MLRERLGGHTPPDLSHDIMNAIDGRAAPAHRLSPSRPVSPWLAAAASLAVAAALALAASVWWLNPGAGSEQPPVADERGHTPRIVPSMQDGVDDEGAPAKRPDEPSPQPDRSPARPENTEDTEDTIESPARPGPGPEPAQPGKAPGDVVEAPEPPPSEPAPEPVKPEDTVETPAPREPERAPTEAETPPPPAVLGSVIFVADRGRLTWRLGTDDKWQDWTPGGEVLSGMHFKVRRPAAIELADGARFYFDGEIAVRGNEESLEVEIADEQVYFDVYGSKRDFTVRRNDAEMTFRDAEVLAARSGLRLQVTCLGGR
jgi:hypothetical protein